MAEREREREQQQQRLNNGGSGGSSDITIHVEDVSSKEDKESGGEEDGGMEAEDMEVVGMQATPPTTGYAMAQMLSGTSLERLDNLGKESHIDCLDFWIPLW